jgi:hypothetical protein
MSRRLFGCGIAVAVIDVPEAKLRHWPVPVEHGSPGGVTLTEPAPGPGPSFTLVIFNVNCGA